MRNNGDLKLDLWLDCGVLGVLDDERRYNCTSVLDCEGDLHESSSRCRPERQTLKLNRAFGWLNMPVVPRAFATALGKKLSTTGRRESIGKHHLLHLHRPPPSLLPLPPSCIFSRGAVTMLSRFAPRAFAAPVRSNAARFTPALRTVTTDAASSHVEKSDVPEVRYQ